MRKPGCNEDNVEMTDVLCDFCMQEWTEARPMVEGHQGSCICGDCLAAAYRVLVMVESAVPETPSKCVLCLEMRSEPSWHMPPAPGALPIGEDTPHACRRCVRQSAAVLQKVTEFGWRKPIA
jgi:hypothetical protein